MQPAVAKKDPAIIKKEVKLARREGTLKRETRETAIQLSLAIDGSGVGEVDTGIPFFNHMLELLAQHALFDLRLTAEGDLDVDPHHTVEDVGISLGEVFRKCLGDKRGIRRYGFSVVPMDESLALVSLDISGRPYLSYEVELPPERIGNFETDLILEFLHAFVNHAAITLHVKLLAGKNVHHMIEAIFKALARALDSATTLDARLGKDVPSTKGKL